MGKGQDRRFALLNTTCNLNGPTSQRLFLSGPRIAFRSSGPACAVIAAGVALDANVIVQDVAYPALRERLLAAKQILTP